MKRRNFLSLFLFLFLFLSTSITNALNIDSGAAKNYVFLFIGDGMSVVQVNASEYYLTSLYNKCALGEANKNNCYPFPGDKYDTSAQAKLPRISFTQYPYTGIATTYGTNSFTPDSADTGTALATGKKTKSGTVSMDPTGKTIYTTIAEVLKSKGMNVGIVSSVSIDHATPAVFYSHSPSRNNYYDIAKQIPTSGFDYFAGGGFVQPTGSKKDQKNIVDIIKESGMKYVNSRADFETLPNAPGQRVVATNPSAGLDSSQALYYDLDRRYVNKPNDHITLAEYTKKGIDLLYDPKGSNGFFMMVESGKIDWANHANDAASSIADVIAFDEAIKTAYDFYKQHPNETIIIVTGDHECGGMTIGFAGTKYSTNFANLSSQKMSYIEFGKIVSSYKNASPPANIADDMKRMISDTFGLDYSKLTDFQKAQLEDAYDRSMAGKAIVGSEQDYLLYGGYDALTVTCTHILNEISGIAWTSYSHTGVPVPVYAVGKESNKFTGQMDNTDIPKKLSEITGYSLPK